MKTKYTISNVEYNHKTETLTWTYGGKDYNCIGEFFVDKKGYLHHSFLTPRGIEKQIKVKVYEN